MSTFATRPGPLKTTMFWKSQLAVLVDLAVKGLWDQELVVIILIEDLLPVHLHVLQFIDTWVNFDGLRQFDWP